MEMINTVNTNWFSILTFVMIVGFSGIFSSIMLGSAVAIFINFTYGAYSSIRFVERIKDGSDNSAG